MGMQVSAIQTTAVKLADNTTLEASAGKLQVKGKGIDTAQINDSAVEELQLNADAVTSAKIKDGEIVDADTDGTLGNYYTDISVIDETEYTETGTAWVEKISKTFTPRNAEDVIIGVGMKFDTKRVISSGSAYGMIKIKITPTNNTASPFSSKEAPVVNDITYVVNSTYAEREFLALLPAGDFFRDTSYTVSVELRLSEINSTLYLDNTLLYIKYLSSGAVTTDSGRFT